MLKSIFSNQSGDGVRKVVKVFPLPDGGIRIIAFYVGPRGGTSSLQDIQFTKESLIQIVGKAVAFSMDVEVAKNNPDAKRCTICGQKYDGLYTENGKMVGFVHGTLESLTYAKSDVCFIDNPLGLVGDSPLFLI